MHEERGQPQPDSDHERIRVSPPGRAQGTDPCRGEYAQQHGECHQPRSPLLRRSLHVQAVGISRIVPHVALVRGMHGPEGPGTGSRDRVIRKDCQAGAPEVQVTTERVIRRIGDRGGPPGQSPLEERCTGTAGEDNDGNSSRQPDEDEAEGGPRPGCHPKRERRQRGHDEQAGPRAPGVCEHQGPGQQHAERAVRQRVPRGGGVNAAAELNWEHQQQKCGKRIRPVEGG